MNLTINDKNIKIIKANTFKRRLLGLMFKKDIKDGLLFTNCNSIHTFFMKNSIDVIMLDKNNKILYLYPNLSKNKILIKKEVQHILELPKNSISNLKINDFIEIK